MKKGFILIFLYIIISSHLLFSELNNRWIEQLNKYSEVFSIVKKHFPEKIDAQKMVFYSIKGFLKKLDPHSYFLDPIAFRSMFEDQSGNYYGIGTKITKYGDNLTIIAPLKDSPAHKLGIKPGDIIISINGKDTRNMSLDEAMKKLRGSKDTYVNIEIMREKINKPIPFKIKRAEIPLNSISYSIVHPIDVEIGFISIRIFSNTTTVELKDSLDLLIKKWGIKSLILDLRGNSGGSFRAAVEISDFFLEKYKLIVSIKGRNVNQNFLAKKNNQYENIPIAILINKGSASASEIVAAALQYHKKAIIIGTRSWGKGLVETVHKLQLNCALALTTAKYYTPSGKCIQRDFKELDDYFFFQNKNIEGGVIPDIYIKSDVFPTLILNLISKGIFFKFSMDLINSNLKIKKKFRANKKIINRFEYFLKKNKVKYSQIELRNHIKSIKYEIERNVLSNKFSDEEGLKIFLKSDPVTKKAVEALKYKVKKGAKWKKTMIL